MKLVICCLAVAVTALGSSVVNRQEPTKQSDAKNAAETKTIKKIRARHFELLDEKGRVRIEMKMDEGNPVFALKDENGNDRVVVFHQPKATGVYIKDKEKHTRIGLAQFPHGGGVAMHGENGKHSAVYVLMNNQARLDVYENGKLTNRWPLKDETKKEKM